MRTPLIFLVVGLCVWFGYSVIVQAIVPLIDMTKALGQ